MPTFAKLTRPKTHRVLRRERLFALIERARERPLVWLSGPPGAGKSTLVASYVEAHKGRAAWYHLDPGDDDIGTFFYYLAQSLPASGKNAPQLPQFGPEHRANLAGYARQFFRQYFARPALLVLDNYHELPEGSAVHEVLDCAVAEIPEGSNIAVISRGGPPRRFARHKLGEKLATIDGEELRTSLEETRAIAALRHDLDEDAIARVHELSRGWAAGLALTLEREEQIRSGRISRDRQAGTEELFEFFAIQVFDSLPAEMQRFLQVSALLPTMTATMAQRLTGREDAEAVLEDLYRRGLFTDRRATEPPTYQYHDLFRAFLSRRHEKAVAPDALAAELHLAGTLLQAANQADHAVRLFLRAGDWPAARGAILGMAGALVSQGRSASLRDWIAAIPRDVIAADPWLNFWAGTSELRTDPVAARAGLMAAFQLFESQDDVVGQAQTCGALIHSHMYEFTDVTPLDRWIDTLTALLERKPRFRTSGAELQVRTALLLALSFRRPKRDSLDKVIAQITDLLGADVPDADAGSACGALMLHFFSTGDVTRGERIATHLRRLHERGVPPAIHALGCIQVGRHSFEKCDHAAGQQAFELALELVAKHGISLPVVTVYSHMGLALIALERDDLALAETHRREVAKWWQPHRRIDEFMGTRLQMWFAFRRGHWEAALDLATRQVQCAKDCGVYWFAFEAAIQRAMVFAELDRPEEFAAALAPVRPMLAGTGYELFEYQVELTEAYYALLRNDRATCHAKLRSGLTRAREEHGKRTLRMHPSLLSRVLAEALTAGIDAEYAQQVIRELHLRPPARDVQNWPWPLRIYTFGQFEVLRDGRPLEYSRKAPKKTIALLKAIIAFGGANVREQRLVDAFWSDEEGDVATRSLGAALHRLRKLIGDAEAIVQQGNTLSLDKARVWVDVWAFEDLLARPDADATEVMSLYRGAFLAEDDGEPWPVTMRERLRGRFIHEVAEIGKRLEDSDRADAAIECYLRGLDADPVIEQFYQGLMRCYAALERRSEALSAYQRLKRMLSISLGVTPSPQTERLYQSLKREAVG
ncbi:MAG TPA: BTAD domain-containing putative transcriptional regulator [Steroidobacteraceae bacterium]|jgi:ATP/maltotriose-dependent transcriptional regulator MalT/DNA-binding SARP family transcriptional activator